MTQVDFYTQVDDKLLLACQVTAKAVAKKLPVVIYASDAGEAAAIDRMLWTTPSTGFIPHCDPTHRLAQETPVIIAHVAQAFPHHQVLVNLQSESPPFFDQFERLIEIVSMDETDKSQARLRWKFYKDGGHAMQSHDMARR